MVVVQLLLLFGFISFCSSVQDLLDAYDVSFLIKTHDRPKSANQLIKSIRQFYPGAPVLVADDGSQPFELDPDTEAASATGPTTVFRLPYDIGLSAARNYLLEQTNSSLFAMLDDDFVFTDRTAVHVLCDVLEHSLHDPPLDIVAGSLYTEGKEPYTYAELLNVVDEGRELKMIRGDRGPVAVPASVAGSAAVSVSPADADTVHCKLYDIVLNFFVGRTARVRAIGWDGQLKLGEHQDFFWRAKQAGLVVAACPALCVARHDQDHSNHAYKQKRLREFQFLRQMLAKHGWKRLRLSTGPVYASIE